MLHFEPRKLLNINFNADPGPALRSNASLQLPNIIRIYADPNLNPGCINEKYFKSFLL
jgi:hypothetical protein